LSNGTLIVVILKSNYRIYFLFYLTVLILHRISLDIHLYRFI